jgi:hypothetical protein
MSNPELAELERRVDLAMKGMNLLLFGEAETVSSRERTELQKRLRDYLKGKDEFVELKDFQGSNSQKRR